MHYKWLKTIDNVWILQPAEQVCRLNAVFAKALFDAPSICGRLSIFFPVTQHENDNNVFLSVFLQERIPWPFSKANAPAVTSTLIMKHKEKQGTLTCCWRWFEQSPCKLIMYHLPLPYFDLCPSLHMGNWLLWETNINYISTSSFCVCAQVFACLWVCTGMELCLCLSIWENQQTHWQRSWFY